MTLRLSQTLAEFGPGFAFVGRQYHLDVDGDDFFVDYSDSGLIPIAA
jgi:predicted nuclease of restriction endonuclease-like (RecB) superfamily